MIFTAQGASDVGRSRTRNEDAYVIDDGLELAVVADGMGGHASGDEASRMASAVFRETLAQNRGAIDAYAESPAGADTTAVRKVLCDAMSRCSKAVFDEGARDPGKKGMGTTVSALLVAGSTAFVAHVGDSRVYLVRDRRIVQLTSDHSLLDQLVAEGEITREEAASPIFNKYRSALSRAIGVNARVETDTLALELLPGDVFVLCSDGLTRYVGEDELAELVRHIPTDRLEAVLIDVANQRGGADNITAVTVRILPDEIEDPQRARRLDELVAILSDSLLFGDLHHAEMLHVLTVARTDAVAPRDAVPGSDDVDELLFAVLAGGGKFTCDDGTVIRLGAGDWFGSLSLLGGDDLLGSLTATEPTRVLRFSRTDLIEILGKSPVIGQQLLESVAG